MKTIFKYPMSIMDRQSLWLRKGATILKVAPQNGVLTLWAEVDNDETVNEEAEFIIVGTGNPKPEIREHNLRYLDTVFMDPFVWHVYELEQVY